MLVGRRPLQAELTIEDLPEGLRFQVRPERRPATTAWNYVYTTLLAYMLTALVSPVWSFERMLLMLCIGTLAGTWLSRQREITTLFTRDGVKVQGAFGTGCHAPRWVPLGDISELSWQPERDGTGDSSVVASGLYARRGLTISCLVPFVDAAQGARALQALERRFSWIDRTPGSADSLLFTDDLVRLEIDR